MGNKGANFGSNLLDMKREKIDETLKTEMGKHVWRQPESCVGDLGLGRSRVKVKVEMVTVDRCRSRCE